VTLVIVAGILARVWSIYGAPPTWVTVLPIYLAFFGTGMALAIASVEVARGRAAPRAAAWCAEHPGLCVGAAVLAFLVSTVLADVTDGPVIEIGTTPNWELL